MSLHDERIPCGRTWPTQTLLKNVHAILIIVITRGTGKLMFKTGILFVVEWRVFCTSRVTPLSAASAESVHYIFYGTQMIFIFLLYSTEPFSTPYTHSQIIKTVLT